MAEGCKLANVFATLLAVSTAHAQEAAAAPVAQPIPHQAVDVRVAEDVRRSGRRAERLQPPPARATAFDPGR